VCGAQAGAAPIAVRTPDLPPPPLAIASLVLGILAYGPLPILGAVLAVVTGHSARRAYRQAPGRYRGKGLSTAGLALGYVQLGLAVLALAGLLIALGIGAFFALLHR
jgi:hypothetical protein